MFTQKNILRKTIGDKKYLMNETIIPYITNEKKEKIISKTMETFNIKENSKKIVTTSEYTTNGENFILIKDVEDCVLTLNNSTTNYIIIKSLSKSIIKTSENKIDEYYDELELINGSCVVLLLFENIWYIISSDGIKLV
jgi:hypothetical protein